MNLQELKTMGAFVTAEPVKASITWKDNVFDVYIKQLAFGEVERMLRDENRSSVGLIAAAVLFGEEKEPISLEDAERLDVSLAAKLLEAVNEANAGKI